MNRRILIAVFPLLLSACSRNAVDDVRLDAFPVRVAAVSARTLEDTLTLVGSLKAKDEATLYARVPGKLQENLVREGDRVKKDQSVALVTRDEVGVKFEPAPVPSTLSGIVARLYLDRGANVTLATPIALVLDDRDIVVKADVPERYVGKISLKQPVRVQVEAFADQTFHGIIHRVSPAIDPVSRTAPIEILMTDGRERLRSGMFAKVNIVVERKSAVLSVPTQALIEDPEKSVYTVEEGKAVRRPVSTGLQTEGLVEIVNGLQPGDRVIVSELFGIKDGSPVEIITDETR